MDLLGPFPRAKSRKEYLVVAVDYFIKWVEVKALTSITSKQIQDIFWEDVIYRFGVPKILITNNRKQFDVGNFRDFCEELSMEQ